MTNPWNGRRHSSWASNTVLTLLMTLACLIAVGIADWKGEPPTYLVALLGTSAGAFFTALGSDKNKREAETREFAATAQKTAERAEGKADHLTEVAEREHPGATHDDGTGG